ncbi:hypothetical protein JCM11491_004338 [Sporobolomyces phaffii]
MTEITRADLEQLPRRDLQARCKANSLKANSTTELLIESLLQHYQRTGYQAEELTTNETEKASAAVTKKHVPREEFVEDIGQIMADLQAREDAAAARRSFEDRQRMMASYDRTATCDQRVRLDVLIDDFGAYKQRQAIREANIPSTIDRRIYERQATFSAKVESRIDALETTIGATKADLERSILAHVARLESQISAERESRDHLRAETEHLRGKIVELERYLQEATEWRCRHEELVEQARERERAVEERLGRLERLERANALLDRPMLAQDDASQSAADEAQLCPVPDSSPPEAGSTSLSLSDAPPTRSLLTFSPIGSPALPAQSTPRHFGSSSALRRPVDSPRLGHSVASPTFSPVRASALPLHMIPSTSLRSPRVTPALGSEVPVGPATSKSTIPVVAASLGKRSRESDASNLSVDLEAVVRPTQVDLREFNSSGRVGESQSSPQKEDRHSRKRSRVSVREDEDELDLLDGARSMARSSTEAAQEDVNDDDEEEEDAEAENSVDSVREYLVPTKTGESPSVVLRPSYQPISDPAFFSAPSSPAVLTPGRRSTITLNENALSSGVAAGSRQSLPVSALPFPLVSPFSNKNRSAPSLGTPAKAAFGNRSNQTSSNLFQSASKSSSTPSFFLSTSKPKLIRPRTPVAAKTLYGTEEESRFGDQFDTAEEDNAGADASWSDLRGGALF